MRRYVVTALGRDHEVEIEPAADGRVRVCVDGRARELDVRVTGGGAGGGPRSISLTCDGRVYAADVGDGAGGDVSVHLAGAALSARVSDADRHLVTRAKSGDPAESDRQLRAPIPGRVIRCLVRTGDAVTVGQPLVIVEAMKMENELRAARAGRVHDVVVREGQAVESGDTLVIVGD